MRLLATGILLATATLAASTPNGHAAPAHHQSLFSALATLQKTFGARANRPEQVPPPTGNFYDINDSDIYCTDGTANCITPCLDYEGCAGAVYAAVDAIGTKAGANSGTPGEIVMECVRGNANGSFTGGWIDVATAAQQTEFDDAGFYSTTGSITGTASLITPNAGESMLNAESSLHVSALQSSEVYGYPEHGTVSGVQNTDNNVDTLNSGGFNITIAGVLYNTYSGEFNGTISCLAGGPKAAVVGGYEGVSTGPEDTLSTNYYVCPAGTNIYYSAEGELEPNPYDEYDAFDAYTPYYVLEGTYGVHYYPCVPSQYYDPITCFAPVNTSLAHVGNTSGSRYIAREIPLTMVC